jgi:hypothetical protein
VRNPRQPLQHRHYPSVSRIRRKRIVNISTKVLTDKDNPNNVKRNELGSLDPDGTQMAAVEKTLMSR